MATATGQACGMSFTVESKCGPVRARIRGGAATSPARLLDFACVACNRLGAWIEEIDYDNKVVNLRLLRRDAVGRVLHLMQRMANELGNSLGAAVRGERRKRRQRTAPRRGHKRAPRPATVRCALSAR